MSINLFLFSINYYYLQASIFNHRRDMVWKFPRPRLTTVVIPKLLNYFDFSINEPAGGVLSVINIFEYCYCFRFISAKSSIVRISHILKTKKPCVVESFYVPPTVVRSLRPPTALPSRLSCASYGRRHRRRTFVKPNVTRDMIYLRARQSPVTFLNSEKLTVKLLAWNNILFEGRWRQRSRIFPRDENGHRFIYCSAAAVFKRGDDNIMTG